MPWSAFVDLLRELLFVLAVPLGGNLGAAIVVLSLGVRLALLPMTLRLARSAQRTQARIRALAPELARLKQRYASDPVALGRAMQSLYRANGIGVIPRGSGWNLLVQGVVGAGLYQAITQGVVRGGRFLWITDLAQPDALVAFLAAGLGTLAGLLVSATPGTESARNIAMVSGLVTFVVAWRLASGLGLYWAASGLIGVVQSLLTRRHRGAEAAA